MRKLVFKYIVLLLLVSLSISGCTYDNNDITYKTISMSSVALEIPSLMQKEMIVIFIKNFFLKVIRTWSG